MAIFQLFHLYVKLSEGITYFILLLTFPAYLITPWLMSHILLNLLIWELAATTVCISRHENMSTDGWTRNHLGIFHHSLVGGLEHDFYCSIYWKCHPPNWRTLIFFSWVGSTTNQFIMYVDVVGHEMPGAVPQDSLRCCTPVEAQKFRSHPFGPALQS